MTEYDIFSWISCHFLVFLPKKENIGPISEMIIGSCRIPLMGTGQLCWSPNILVKSNIKQVWSKAQMCFQCLGW